MTREEAKQILKEHKITFQHDFGWNISVLEALDMAISALKEEPAPFDFELFQAGLMDIPEGMTNGEVIQALFPNHLEGIYKEEYVEVVFKGQYHTTYFALDFWNAPYQKGGEE